jgi:hypothetical protein
MRESDVVDPVSQCAGVSLGVVGVLSRHGLIVGGPRVDMSVREKGNPKRRLHRVQKELAGAERPQDVVGLLEEMERDREAGEVAVVDAHIVCAGRWIAGAGECLAERAFAIDTVATATDTTVTLSTYCDAWMSHDLRGREQRDVCAANQPRLAAALNGISEYVGDEVEPGESTWFGRPTESGVDNILNGDGTVRDVWRSFEAPYRLRTVVSRLPEGSARYADMTEGPVRYLTVAGSRGVLGYLWAADNEDAAGYEPRSAAGEAAFDAALVWLLRLGEAKASGLSPRQALSHLKNAVEHAEAGRVVPDSEAVAWTLDALQDFSGRE